MHSSGQDSLCMLNVYCSQRDKCLIVDEKHLVTKTSLKAAKLLADRGKYKSKVVLYIDSSPSANMGYTTKAKGNARAREDGKVNSALNQYPTCLYRALAKYLSQGTDRVQPAIL